MELEACRFCLQPTELVNIFEFPDKLAKLQVQASCIGAEMFEGDGMPTFVCRVCTILIEIFHGYKQICKKAELALKQYTFMTKKLPEPFKVSLDQIRGYLVDSMPRKAVEEKGTETETLPTTDQSTQSEPPPKEKTPTPIKETPSKNSSPSVKEVKNTPKKECPEVGVETVVEGGVQYKIIQQEVRKRSVEIGKELERIEQDGITLKLINVPPSMNKRTSKPPGITKKPRLLNAQTAKPKMENIDVTSVSEANEGEVVMKIVQYSIPGVFACTYCERTYPLRQQLEIHEQNHFRERDFGCDLCDNKFFSKFDLQKHLQTHSVAKPWVCVVCKRSFSRANILKQHERVHADQMKYNCTKCDKKFLVQEDLDCHDINEHERVRPFKCSMCAKSFKYKQGLERHLPSHSTDLPFPCEHCPQSFNTAGKLARHLQTHAGERRYPCKYCDKVFKWSHHLSRHTKSHLNTNLFRAHVNESLHELTMDSEVASVSPCFTCGICNESFDALDAFVEHLVFHCENDGKCPICEMEGADDVEAHIRTHLEEVNLDFEGEEMNLTEDFVEENVPVKIKCEKATIK